ncbi:bifunctional 2-C-methyl-D-erythritol 4-phosphate cytidylyltransferase/2-C-methyl-D-erythritol 2,4-cyclodiphosphate synthase [Amphiplicatus metriothermophilus]|uniref:Bifunctional enzyme IspD/IspF n=1 Tax=Amphiplicatus metriothermophilus TaxID=1519374 RepID=A0A239PX06_9PROT|nr:bifunctional 2-C-methyl-D-erythritol 4-phosphate cytidylyltransferase/2-C-methyl-D-erythritol 2,4-cyclodiphosphate synthase [Amphiplicatus metriothermophilus]MBB5519960.1 2-C-methyl-D-erythritol 4-phosphate cytidylyltransferase/2-C-methyl-D-erythritol 2,4-cyclodiphosphate synthase [Amphiplicatus metriothermophilus]SNT74861.1 2-C-methyl-D-erythritol 2,4-cyclodiphosphate synthase [Amphiplicatus metriothermophilus]
MPVKPRHAVALIVAAGRGTRAGEGGPKQYRLLAGKPVLAHAAAAFLDHPQIDAVRVIIHSDDGDAYAEAMAEFRGHPKLLAPVHGGAERQDSVRLGLESLESDPPTLALIHDAARPFVSGAVISNVIEALGAADGAIAALPVFDTIKRAEGGHIAETVPRERLWRAQTPQGFRYRAILDAHRKAAGKAYTDDAAVAEAAGLKVALALGSPDNMKITQAEDFGMAETLLRRKAPMHEYRTGHGYDVHAFEPGEAVILCGVSIPHEAKLKGHSDADAGMHALTDAIFGALGAGDIGDHFSPSDPQWKGAASSIFLRKACELVREAGGAVTHCDVTLVCEAPKIGPHRDAMRAALGEIMELDASRISVKATTTEKLGFTGRREGIAAFATATIRLPAR